MSILDEDPPWTDGTLVSKQRIAALEEELIAAKARIADALDRHSILKTFGDGAVPLTVIERIDTAGKWLRSQWVRHSEQEDKDAHELLLELKAIITKPLSPSADGGGA